MANNVVLLGTNESQQMLCLLDEVGATLVAVNEVCQAFAFKGVETVKGIVIKKAFTVGLDVR